MKVYKETFFNSLCHECIIYIIAILNSNNNSITLYPQSFETICIKITYANKIILKSSPTLILLHMFLKIILQISTV